MDWNKFVLWEKFNILGNRLLKVAKIDFKKSQVESARVALQNFESGGIMAPHTWLTGGAPILVN